MLKRSTSKLLPGFQSPGTEIVKAVGPDRIKVNLLIRRRAARRLLVDARHEKNAIEHVVKLPRDGESLHLIIDGRFEPCDLIPATRRLSDPATIRELIITTLGFNVDNISTIVRGMDAGKIGTVTVICSHYFMRAEKALYELTLKEIGGRGGKVYGLRSHTKIILMEMTNGASYTIEGSGNLRSCRSIEQFCMTNDRRLYEFQRDWILDYIKSTGN